MGEFAHGFVFFFGQHFQPVDDGPDRRNHIMADTAAQQGPEVERIQIDLGHRFILRHRKLSGAVVSQAD